MTAEVQTKLQELYLHQDPAVRKAADAALQEFQKTDLAWAVSQELLGSSDQSFQFFGAQTLLRKVQWVAQGYDQSASTDLRALVPILQQLLGLATLSQQAKQQLVLALAAIAVHLCKSTWNGAVVDLLTLANDQPQQAWCALLTIPEQLSAVVHTYLKTDKRTLALLASSDALMNASLNVQPSGSDDAMTGTNADSAFSLAMQALIQWSKVMGLSLVSHEAFAARLVALLQGPAGSSEVVLELVLEVLRNSPGAFAIYDSSKVPAPGLQAVLAAIAGCMRALLPQLQQMAQQPPLSLDKADGSKLTRWARVAGTLVEAYTQVLWVDRGVAEVLIAFLASCFMVHPHVAQPVFELWAILKDANRDQKLPPGVLSGLLQQLVGPCITSFMRFGRWNSPHAEDKDELEHLRSAQQDILVDMYCIAAGTPEAQMILTQLCDHLRNFEAAKDWHGVEAVWYAFYGIAEVLVDEPPIPEAYQMVLESIFRAEVSTEEQCTTAATLLRVCGPHFDQILKPQLVQSVQWLVGVMQRIPTVASEALQEISGYAGQHLLPHVDELLKVISGVAPSLAPEVDASLHGALVGIVRGLPRDQAIPAFVRIADGSGSLLAPAVDVSQEVGRQQLHRCIGRLLRCGVVMKEGGTETSSGPQVSPAAQTASTCLAQVLNSQWQPFALPCQQLLCAAPVAKDALKGKPIYEYSDTAVQVNIIALMRAAAKAATEALAGGQELGAHVVEFAVACCKEGQLAPLSAVALMVSDATIAKACIMPILDGICQETLKQIQAGRSDVDLIPVLDLLSGLAAGVGEDLFLSPQLPLITQLCILAVRSTDQDILKPALNFLLKLLMSRSPGALAQLSGPEQNVRSIIEAVLGNFHLWPRILGSLIFKIFSAFLERHEAVFMPLALSPCVPSVASLEPAEQQIAQRAFQALRGARLRAFLGDLGAVARRDNTADILQMYAMEAAPPGSG